jgi:hypothetical protein
MNIWRLPMAKSVWLTISMMLMALQAVGQPCPSQDIHYRQISDEQLLIINLRINGFSVITDLEVYQIEDRLLLPLDALINQLTLPIKLTEHQLSSTPTLADKNCALNWQLHTEINQTNTIQDQLLLWGEDDFGRYIDAEILNLLLLGQYQFDYALQQLTINTDLALSILAETDQPAFQPMVQELILPELVVADQYQWLNFPVISYTAKQQFNAKLNTYKSSSQINGFFDFLGHKAELRYNHSEQANSQFFKLSRNINLTDDNYSDNILNYQLGDIQSQRDELVHQSMLGAGFALTNKNPTYNSSFSSITISEPALPGWRAELYRNGQFIAQTETSADNQVIFNHVDTFYGFNLFEIKLYGPEGQQTTKTQKLTVGNSLLSQHNWNFQLEYLDPSKRILSQTLASRNGIKQSAVAKLSYGLTNQITLDVAGHLLNIDDTNHYYLSTALNGFIFNGGYNIQAAQDSLGGFAFNAGYSGNLAERVNINLNYNKLHNFTSGVFDSEQGLESQFNVRLNGATDYLTGLNWSARYSHKTHATQARQNIYGLVVSKAFRQGTMSANFLHDDSQAQEQFLTRLYSSIQFARWRWSNSIDWYPFAERQIKNIRSHLSWPQQQNFYQKTQLNYLPDQLASMQLSHQITYRQPSYNLQLSGQIDNQGDWLVSAGISGTLGFDHVNNQLLFLPPQALTAGLIEAHVFLDENGNDQFDINETALANVGFNGNYSWHNLKTNDKGKVLLPSSFGGQKLSVNEPSLSDPYTKAKLKHILVHSHKGGITKVQIPVLTVNDIEGSIYQVVHKNTKAAPAQTVALLNIAGETVAKTYTEYDGYFAFSLVPPGTYSISISSELITERQLTPLNLPQKIIAAQPGDAIVLSDILLVDQPYLLAQQQSEQPQLALEHDNDQFFVQLGVYNRYLSIYQAAQALPPEVMDIQIFYHQQNHRYYLVTGPFNHAQDATSLLAKLKTIKQFEPSFLVRTSRYMSEKWQLNYSLHDLPLKLNQGYELVQQASATSYFCQLASYRALNSIESAKFDLNKALFIVKRSVNNKMYYSLMVGPFTNQYGENCQLPQYQTLTPEQSTDRTSKMLKQEVVQ